MGINLNIDTRGLKRIEKSLYGLRKQIPGATASALNRTLDYASNQWGKHITQRYTIKASDVKGKIKKYPASKLVLTASMNVSGGRLSFAHFPYTPKSPGTKKQVRVKVKKESGYKQIGTKRKPFIAATGAKSADKTQYNVFKRTTSKRLPIVVLRTLSLPQMASNKEVSEKVQSLVQKKLKERIGHEIKWRLEKAAREVK